MKKALFVLVLLLASNHILLTAQGNKSFLNDAKIGITFSSFGANEIVTIPAVKGGPSFDSKSFYNFGITYIKGLNCYLELETGLEYSKHNIIYIPNAGTGSNPTRYNKDFSIIDIPVTLRVNFLKYFFINGGLLLDIDVSSNTPVDRQIGLGTMLGIGVKYDWNNGVGVFVNPYSKMHSVVPFVDRHLHQMVSESGFRFGITYKIR